jgi:hypothetical protein
VSAMIAVTLVFVAVEDEAVELGRVSPVVGSDGFEMWMWSRGNGACPSVFFLPQSL